MTISEGGRVPISTTMAGWAFPYCWLSPYLPSYLPPLLGWEFLPAHHCLPTCHTPPHTSSLFMSFCVGRLPGDLMWEPAPPLATHYSLSTIPAFPPAWKGPQCAWRTGLPHWCSSPSYHALPFCLLCLPPAPACPVYTTTTATRTHAYLLLALIPAPPLPGLCGTLLGLTAFAAARTSAH